jgi:hypothetical protein
MPRYGNDLALRAHETGYGPVVTSERYDAVEMRLAFQGRQARRDHGPDLEAVGGGRARTDAEVCRANIECRPVLETGGTVSRSNFSLISTQNLKCQSTRKLCPSTRWTTFIKVDFEVFR